STKDGMSDACPWSLVLCQLLTGNVGGADAAQFAVSAGTGDDPTPAAKVERPSRLRSFGRKAAGLKACAARFSSQRSDYLFSVSRNSSTVIPAFAIRLRNVPRAISG